MRHRIQKSVWILSAVSITLLIAAVFGILEDDEPLFGICLSLSVLTALFLPLLLKHNSAVRKLQEKNNPLAVWEYSYHEAEEVAKELKSLSLKRNRVFAWIGSVCLLIIMLPFVFLFNQDGQTISPYIYGLMLLTLLLPWALNIASASILAGRVMQEPCVTAIGRNYLLLANTYHLLNNRDELRAIQAEILPAASCDTMSRLRVVYYNVIRMKYGQIKRKDAVDIPIPHGQETSAEQIVMHLCK